MAEDGFGFNFRNVDEIAFGKDEQAAREMSHKLMVEVGFGENPNKDTSKAEVEMMGADKGDAIDMMVIDGMDFML